MNIFCIMGYTASGKDTVVNEISKNEDIRKIVPVTTRPMRDGECNGIDYFFYDEEYFQEESNNLVAIRDFKVWNGDIWNYAFDKRAFNGDDNVIMSTDLTGFRDIEKNFPEDNVVGIFLDVPISILIKRLEERKTPEEEIKRRIIHDREKYDSFFINHSEKLYVVSNIDLKKSIFRINNIIKNESKKGKR